MKIYEQLLELFKSRPEVYAEAWWNGKADTKRWAYKRISKELNAKVVARHCQDKEYAGIGIYPLLNNNECKWVSADFDVHNEKEKKEVNEAIQKIYELADISDLHLYKEYSKSGKGIHLWMFFTVPVESWKARKLMMGLIQGAGAIDLSSMDRLFPSQDTLHQKSKGIGNLIHMPFSAHFIKEGCYFVDRRGDKYRNNADDIEAWMDTVSLETPEKLDVVLDQWGFLKAKDSELEIEHDDTNYEFADDGLAKVMEEPFMVWCRENYQKVDYNAWLGLITNLLPFGEAGKEAIHKLSALDIKRYDKEDTNKKIIDCDDMTPITYNWLAKNTDFGQEERPNVSYKSPVGAGVKRKAYESPIFEAYGSYWFDNKDKGNYQIANFTLTPKSNVVIDSKIERIFDIHAQKKIITDVQINGDVLSSLDKFRRVVSEYSVECQFFGNINHLLKLQEYINQTYPSIREINGVKDIGIHKAKNELDWTVITQSSAWNNKGRNDNYVYYNTVDKGITLSPDVKVNNKELSKMAVALMQFNEFAICSAIVGWLGAIMVKQRLYVLHNHRFPAMIVHGQAGSGKTETGRKVMQRWFGDIGTMFSIGDLTKFVMLKLNGSTNTFPLFLDEYKPSMIGEDKVKFISQMVRTIYDQSTASRGKADQTIEEYTMTSPIAIMGETGFTEPALIERSIDIFMAKMDSAKHLDDFTELSKLPLDRLGNSYLNWTLGLTDDYIVEAFEKEKIKLGTDRVEHNIAMMNLGLELLHQYFKTHKVKFPVDRAKEAVAERQLELVKESGEVTTAVDNILRAMITMKQSNIVGEECICNAGNEDELAVDTRVIYPYFKKWARETAFEYEIIPEKEFNKQVKKMGYYICARSVRMDGQSKYARVFDVQKLIRKDIMTQLSEHEQLRIDGEITTVKPKVEEKGEKGDTIPIY